MNKNNILKIIRIVLGLIFLWAFFDKLLGLGFATTPDKAWINGGSPTYGFLTNGVKGVFSDFFHSLAGLVIVDWLFMIGLFFIGATLVINRYVKWGSIAGMVMVVLMWLAVFPPANNPVFDDHVIYALIFALLFLEARRK